MRAPERQLVGRQAELAAADRVLGSLALGPAALVLIGEPGIGKTTIWDAIVGSATGRGLQVRASRPSEAEAELSFAGLADLLNPVFDAVVDGLPAPQRAAIESALLRGGDADAPADFRALGSGLLTALDRLARRGPLVIAIDDVQWLDQPTARVVEFAARRLNHQPVGFVVASRPTGAGAGTWLERALPLDRVETLRLGPLSLAGLHSLIVHHLGVGLTRPSLTRLERASGGNPLLALEIIRSLVATGQPLTLDAIVPAPGDIRELVRARTGRLSTATRQALLAAAALADPELSVIAAALPAFDIVAVLEPAEDAGLIVIDDGVVRFGHPLFGSAIQEGSSPTQIRHLHRRLSEVVSDPEAAARHLAAATVSPDQHAAAALESAAEQAGRRGAPDAVASLLEHAIRLTPLDDNVARGRRETALARSLWEVGDVARSRSVVDGAIARLPPGRERATATLVLGMHVLSSDGADAAIPTFERALTDADGDPILESIAHIRLSQACEFRVDRAREHMRAAVELLEPPGVEAPPDLIACATIGRAERDVLAGERYDVAAVERARSILLPAAKYSTLPIYAWGIARECDWLLRLHTDDVTGAYASMLETFRHDREIGLDRAAPFELSDLVEVACYLGDIAAARSYTIQASEFAEQTGRTEVGRAAALVGESTVAAYEGRLEQAGDAAAEASTLLGAQPENPLAPRLLALQGFIALSEGRASDAVQLYAEAHELLTAGGARNSLIGRFRGDEIEGLVQVGQLERARERLGEIDDGAQRIPSPWLRAIGERSRALLAASDGDLEAAGSHAEAALEHLASLPMPVERGRTLLLLGRVQRRRKAKRAAADALGLAAEVFERHGAVGWAARARSELARVGLRPSASGDLTATEAAVARLAASGMTNRQVAEALVLSPKTIDGVLGRVYSKLDIHSRAELGARMAEIADDR